MGLVFPPSTGRMGMRGLVLFLPVLLVLLLAGNAKTEEESSLVGEADLHSNLLPAGEKVEVREAREAGKGNEGDKGKKKLEKKKKNGLRKKGGKGTKEKENKKNIKEERAEKRKNSRKLKKGKNTDAKGKKP